MKYTIELTENQKKQMDFMLYMANKHMGFNRKLEMIETTNVEDTNEYQIGYKTGYDIAQTNAQATKEEWGKAEYNRGYNAAITDYNAMIQWLHDCTDDFKEFMNKKYGYDVMYLTNPKVDEGVMLYDLICDHDIAEVINEFQKWREEKKIKIGDEVSRKDRNDCKVVIVGFIKGDMANAINFQGSSYIVKLTEYERTGRHFDEIEQLLSKLKIEVRE